MKTWKSWAGTLLAAYGLSGCAHTQPAQVVEAPTKPAEPAVTMKVEAPPAPAPAEDPGAELAALLKGTVLRFDFNEATLRADSRELLQKVSDAMQAHKEAKLRISGNCDERGTEEFNLHLGQRRADAAKKYLLGLGVSADRVSTVSFGKDRPVDDGHNEQSWAANRRDELEPNRGM